jgi:hypothetical protein
MSYEEYILTSRVQFILLTMGMDTHTAGCDVCSYCEVRKPQVFNVCITKRAEDSLVEIPSRKHRSYRICQIQELAPPLG